VYEHSSGRWRLSGNTGSNSIDQGCGCFSPEVLSSLGIRDDTMLDELAPAETIDPYASQIPLSAISKTKRRETKGKVVAVCSQALDKHGLKLILQPTRVLCKHEIHELVTTDEADAGPNKTVNRMAAVCFFEVTQGGSVAVGNPVFIGGKEIGKLAGFDETHFPNHYNIVVYSLKKFTGLEAGFKLNDKLRIGG